VGACTVAAHATSGRVALDSVRSRIALESRSRSCLKPAAAPEATLHSVDRFEVILTYRELPIGGAERAEPVINGEPLADTVRQVEPDRSGYAGREDERWLGALRDQKDASVRVKVLGCGCGVDGCASVSVEVVRTESAVIWRDFRASGAHHDLDSIGPFRFDPTHYANAIARPVRAQPGVRPSATDEF